MDRSSPQHKQARGGTGVAPDQRVIQGVTYTVIGDEERVDPVWESAHADERRESFTIARREISDGLRRARAEMPLHQRLFETQRRIAGFTTVRGSRMRGDERDQNAGGPTTTSDAGSIGGRHPGIADVCALGRHPEEEIERHLVAVLRHVEFLESAIDEHLGLAPAVDYATMRSEEKDRLILDEFIGWKPDDVSEHAPALGSAYTIRRVREQAGMRGVCGHPRDACTCVGVRKPARKAAA